MILRFAVLCGLLFGCLMSSPVVAAEGLSPCINVALGADSFTVCEFSAKYSASGEAETKEGTET